MKDILIQLAVSGYSRYGMGRRCSTQAGSSAKTSRHQGRNDPGQTTGHKNRAIFDRYNITSQGYLTMLRGCSVWPRRARWARIRARCLFPFLLLFPSQTGNVRSIRQISKDVIFMSESYRKRRRAPRAKLLCSRTTKRHRRTQSESNTKVFFLTCALRWNVLSFVCFSNAQVPRRCS